MLAGVQKYFTVLCVILALVSAGAAVTYRASYRVEQARRAELETSLQRTAQSLEELTLSSRLAIDALTRASASASAIAEQRRVAREIIIKAPNDQDGPVAPVLRDAVNGMR